MSDNLAHIFVNFSKRKVTLVDEEGYENTFNGNGTLKEQQDSLKQLLIFKKLRILI